MYIIVGLGNPTKEYDNTRHNIGFELIDRLSSKYGISVMSLQHKAKVGKGMIGSDKVILVKPQTYMNLSGESVAALVNYYKVDPESELIVVSDDIELPPGYIRVRPKGSAGGHNGLKNIIALTGTSNFKRVRVGVGMKPSSMDLADYVLGHFSKDEKEAMEKGLDQAISAIELIMNDRIDEAMNLYNKKVTANNN